MSSTKVRTLNQRIKFTATYDTLNSLLVVTTAIPHLLVTADVVSLVAMREGPHELIDVAVTVTGASSFTVAIPNHGITEGEVKIEFFRTGFVGRVIFTLPRSAGNAAVVQSFVTGTGGAAYTLDLSLDGVHWVTAASVTHPAVNGDTGFQTISPAWVYGSVNISAVGAATKLEVLQSN